MEITAAAVKKLREETGAGFAQCKQALSECEGDFAKAKDWLSVKGASAAQKKAGRATTEGVVAVAEGQGRLALAEVLSETDFVAGNEVFQDFAAQVAAAVLAGAADGALEGAAVGALAADGGTVEQLREQAMLKIGENIQLGRAATIAQDGPDASLHWYVHHNRKIGVVARIACPAAKAAEVGKNVCMQIAAMAPQVVAEGDFDEAQLDRIKKLFADELAGSGKPPEIQEKIAAGKLRKYLADQVLLKQEYIMGDSSVEDYLAGHGAQALAFQALRIGG